MKKFILYLIVLFFVSNGFSQNVNLEQTLLRKILLIDVSINDILKLPCAKEDLSFKEIDSINKQIMPIIITHKLRDNACVLEKGKNQFKRYYININKHGQIVAIIAESNEISKLKKMIAETLNSPPANASFTNDEGLTTYYWATETLSVTLINSSFFSGIIVANRNSDDYFIKSSSH